ncbi:MAG: 50S ribosomal protein L10 [bacterium]|nr:50S ribosomal protein L10 [bacterium]
MATTREKKKAILARINDYIPQSKSIVFVDMQGLTVKSANDLRTQCDQAGIRCLVAKKTLLAKALEDAGITEVTPRTIEGEIAATFSMEDEIAPAKLFTRFAKDHEGFSMKAGLMMSEAPGNRLLDTLSLNQLATLPSREELLAKLVGSLNAPVSGIVNVLAGNLRGLVTVLHAMSEKTNV